MKRIVIYMGKGSRLEMDDMLAKEGIGPKGRTLQLSGGRASFTERGL
jgi:hypothetical protein